MSSAHEGRFHHHMHTMLEAGRVVRLDLPLPDGDLDLAAVRSTRVGTLATAIQQLEASTGKVISKVSPQLVLICLRLC